MWPSALRTGLTPVIATVSSSSISPSATHASRAAATAASRTLMLSSHNQASAATATRASASSGIPMAVLLHEPERARHALHAIVFGGHELARFRSPPEADVPLV